LGGDKPGSCAQKSVLMPPTPALTAAPAGAQVNLIATGLRMQSMHRVLLCGLLYAGAALAGLPLAPARAGDADACANWKADEAVGACSQVIAQNPSAAAYANRGYAYWGRRAYDLAIVDFDRAIRLDPNLASAWNGRGNAHSDKGDYDLAITDYDRAIRIDQKLAAAWSSRGNAFWRKRDYDRAISDYNQALRLDPNYAAAYNGRGNAYHDKHDHDRAIADYDRALRLDPRLAAAHNSRGNAYYDKGGYDRAIADYDQAIWLDAKMADAWNDRGRARLALHEYDRAIADYDQAIRIDPNLIDAYDGRGNARLALHEYDRALTDYDQAIRLDPNAALPYNGRGAARNGKDEYDRAIAELDKAIQLNPALANAFSHRGYAYGRKGDFDRAMADLNRAIALNPGLARGYANRAAIGALRGDAGRAIADADEAIRLDPKGAFAYNVRGKAYFDAGQYALAILDYEQAIRLDPKLAEARQNRERAKAVLALSQPSPQQAAPAVPSLQPKPAAAPQPEPLPIAERRVALVIGNSTYAADAALPNPRRDAEAVAAALREAGFQTVIVKGDLGRDAMRDALRAFRVAADAADWGLIYYAGHGIQIGKTNYLVPVDARLRDERDVDAETVSYGELVKAIGGAKVLRIIILDACRADPFERQMVRLDPSRAVTRGLSAPPEPRPGLLIVYSAMDGQLADDGDGAHSPFATALIAHIKDPGREVRRMFDDVSADVLEATKDRQQPFTYGSLPGRRDFFFVAGK
jgi:tetratricopeptide (TPR) repeat protein